MPCRTTTSPSPGVPAAVKGLSLVSLFNDFASEMVYPLLPAFVTGQLGGGAELLGLRQVEWDGDGDGLEGDAPFAGEIEPGPDPGDPHPAELLLELGHDRLQPGSFDGESEVADRRGPEIRLVKPQRLGRHGNKHT